MMQRVPMWFAVLVVLGIYMQNVSGQLDSTILNRRNSINSTMTSFSNNVVNKMNDYANKFTSLRSDMSGQLSSASQTLTSLMTDSVIGSNAVAASDVLSAASSTLSSSVQASITVSGTFSTVTSCVNTKTQASVSATFTAIGTANTNFFNTVTSSSSQYASSCRSKYSNTPNDLVNQAADRVQDCLNQENTQLSRVSSILNNYLTLMRQEYQSQSNHVRYCSGLGSSSSRAEVKAEIAGCLGCVVSNVGPVYKATLEQQYQLAMAMLQVEIVSSNNRVKSCVQQVTETYKAMADALVPALNTCLSTGQ